MKVSNFITNFLKEKGIKDIFVSGSQPIVESLDLDDDIRLIVPLSEQAGGMMANGYSKLSNGLSVVLADTVLGGTGLLTSMYQAYNNDLSTLFITGVKAYNSINMARKVTKLAVRLSQKELIRYYLEKLAFTAREGWHGSVILEIPDLIQVEDVSPEILQGYNPPEGSQDLDDTKKKIRECSKLLKSANRPVVLLGHGVWAGRAEIMNFIDRFNVPVVEAFNAVGIIPFEHKCYRGRFMTSDNLIVKESDFLLSIGSDMNFEGIAPKAKKVLVDSSPESIEAGQNRIVVHMDNKEFAQRLLTEIDREAVGNLAKRGISKIADWRNRTANLRNEEYNEFLAEDKDREVKDFIVLLSDILLEDSILVYDSGLSGVIGHLFRAKLGQRVFSGHRAFPVSIGASLAAGKQVVCLTNDKDLSIDLQELRVAVKYNLPLKIFVLDGDERLWKVIEAYGVKIAHACSRVEIKEVLEGEGLVVCGYKKLEEEENGG